MMSAMASQLTGVSDVYSTVCSDADKETANEVTSAKWQSFSSGFNELMSFLIRVDSLYEVYGLGYRKL